MPAPRCSIAASRAGDRRSLRQARSAAASRAIRSCSWSAVVAALTTVLFIRDIATGADNLVFSFQIILWLWFTVLFANFAEAVAEGRGKAQAETLRRTKEELKAKLYIDEPKGVWIPVSAQGLVPGNVVLVEAGRRDPVGRRGHRGRRFGQRSCDHRRKRAGHPRGRRRSLGRDRRHRRHLRLDQGQDHRRAGLDLPRPDDRARRRRAAPEDAERDRAQHPARRHDHHLRAGGRDRFRALPPMPAAQFPSWCSSRSS